MRFGPGVKCTECVIFLGCESKNFMLATEYKDVGGATMATSRDDLSQLLGTRGRNGARGSLRRLEGDATDILCYACLAGRSDQSGRQGSLGQNCEACSCGQC